MPPSCTAADPRRGRAPCPGRRRPGRRCRWGCRRRPRWTPGSRWDHRHSIDRRDAMPINGVTDSLLPWTLPAAPCSTLECCATPLQTRPACPSSWATSSACCCASCRRAKSAWAISKRYSAFAAHVVAAARRAAQRRHSGHAARRQEYLLPCGRPQGLAGAGLAVPPLLPEGRRAMTINWSVFTPVSALFRGVLIGLVTTLPLLLNGCVAGIATSSAACWSAWARGSARVIPSRPHFLSAYTSCVQRCAQRATPKRALTQTPASSGTRS